MFTFTNEQFSGPLDVLLQMVEGDTLKITDVSLVSITDAYIDHIQRRGIAHESEMADFLVIATKLLYLKSKELLPQIVIEDESGVDITRQLKMYEQFARASEEVRLILEAHRFMYPREQMTLKVSGFYPPKTITALKISSVMRSVIDRFKPEVVLSEVKVQKVMSIAEKIASVQEYLKTVKKSSFKDLVADPHSKADVIVTFLALLELVKTREIRLDQRDTFDHIYIDRHEISL